MADARRNLSRLTESELDSRLLLLGGQIAWPQTPPFDLPPHQPAPPPRRVVRPHAWLAAAAAILLAVSAALIAFDGLRESVAGVLGVRGIEIGFLRGDDPPPTPSDLDPLDERVLGAPVTIADAVSSLPFTPRLPALIDEPSGMALRTLPGGEVMLSVIYPPSDTLPEAEETGAGMLLMQFQSGSDLTSLLKSATQGFGSVEEVSVDGSPGYWVEGATWLTIIDDASGASVTRPSANVLLWQNDGITFRMESALDRDASIALAESLRPVTTTT
ncbi:MAG: hypothetical protein IT335_11750 [Thermomicrobiales bacterium]|jgi:hypothetical protein|nr:hypothetical protein [Thermomicrobiales bacterium]